MQRTSPLAPVATLMVILDPGWKPGRRSNNNAADAACTSYVLLPSVYLLYTRRHLHPAVASATKYAGHMYQGAFIHPLLFLHQLLSL
jgi:hypothetical protein